MLSKILLSIVSICTFISYLPQIIKLLKTKKSDDLSIKTWILSIIACLCATIYAIVVSGDFMLIFETSLEVILCTIIFILVLKYRNNCK